MGRQVAIVGYIVTAKTTRTKKGDIMHFGTFIDRQGILFDTTHFPNVAKKHPIRGRGVYLIKGRVDNDFGHPSIEVQYIEKLPTVSKFDKSLH